MRHVRLAFPLVLLTSVTVADAERVGGGGGGGGRGSLGQVSSGINRATVGGAGDRGGGGGHGHATEDTGRAGRLYRREVRDCPVRIDGAPNEFGPNAPFSCRGRYIAVIAHDGTVVREYQPPPPSAGPGTANLDFFIGAHKVVDSDGAVAIAVAVDDRWFRIAGTLTRYHEEQLDGSMLSMTMPTLTAGVRLDGGRSTRAFLEGGVVLASTKNDPIADSSITGAIGGVHLEHWFTPSGRRALIGDAHAMYFESDVKAYSGRLGVRVGILEAALRVLDFNVGPALYGPELGLRF